MASPPPGGTTGEASWPARGEGREKGWKGGIFGGRNAEGVGVGRRRWRRRPPWQSGMVVEWVGSMGGGEEGEEEGNLIYYIIIICLVTRVYL